MFELDHLLAQALLLKRPLSSFVVDDGVGCRESKGVHDTVLLTVVGLAAMNGERPMKSSISGFHFHGFSLWVGVDVSG